jgi:hypothetical protein
LRDHVPATNALTRSRHAERLGDSTIPKPDATPELAAAWHSLQLHWLRSTPGYRRLVQLKVAEAMRTERRSPRRYGGEPVPAQLVAAELRPLFEREGFESVMRRADVSSGGDLRSRLLGTGTIPLSLADQLLTKGLGDPGALYRILARDDVDELGRAVEGCG